VIRLAVVLGASYLLMFLVPLFAWPDWVMRLSVFGAFGNPYLELPETTSPAPARRDRHPRHRRRHGGRRAHSQDG